MDKTELKKYLRKSDYPLEVVVVTILDPTSEFIEKHTLSTHCKVVEEQYQITKERNCDGKYITSMIDKWCDDLDKLIHKTHPHLFELNYNILKF